MPFFSVLENMTVGEPYLLSDMTRFIGDAGREILEQTVMYREWNKPHGLLDSFCIALIKRPQELVCLNLTLRSDRRPVVDDDRRLVSRLVPHITRAAMIGDQLAIEQRSGGVYRDLLDQMTHSIIIVSRGMRIVYANAAAEQMLSEGVLLRSQRGRLIVTNPAAAERIENDVRLSAYLEHELDGCNFSVPLGDPFLPSIAHVVPLARRDAAHRFSRDGVAAIVVAGTAPGAGPSMDAVAALYGLTSAERRVAQLTAGGLTRAAIAEIVGVKESTVKSQLEAIFSKTGVSGQTALSILMRDLSPPLR